MNILKFEIEVLNTYTYGELLVAKSQTMLAMSLANTLKEMAILNGKIRDAAKYEHDIMIDLMNLETIDVVMTNKEGEIIIPTDYESYSLN